MKRATAVIAATMILIASTTTSALACAALIGPDGAVRLVRTTTFAGYHDGIEHYVTAFEYAGDGAAFGSIIPLPGVPSDVAKGGDWTLQRLVLETSPILQLASRADAVGAAEVEVLLETRIDALDITVLKGGGEAVAEWAGDRGFRLPDDGPEVLDFYAQRSPIFLAAVFDGEAAEERGQLIGDGTPVHITIPTPNPWVPLRILGMGQPADGLVEADVFLLTDREPAILPELGTASTSGGGLFLDYSAPASESMLADLRSDRGMEWVPETAWLTKVRIDVPAGELVHDLAVDATGRGEPSHVAAGLGPAVGSLESPA